MRVDYASRTEADAGDFDRAHAPEDCETAEERGFDPAFESQSMRQAIARNKAFLAELRQAGDALAAEMARVNGKWGTR